ncbi:MAG: 5,6-dimethylbenzimidazole synthase [Candidatus Thorarchaeota archaeon AB_25]|nr:MAG: 5,6-dimethylbenzimidazole synthase [Candidatus Thorarchaeota archaeon AB_25]
MDTIKTIRDRRSIRKYKPNEVEEENLQIILQAGRWAPSASNKQPWHFIVIRNHEMRTKLADIHDYGRFMKESPVVIVVLGDPAKHPRYYLADPHQAVQNMLLAAHSQGLATCWMGVRDTNLEPQFRKVLEIPEGLRVVCSISLGYGDQERKSTRFPLEDITSWEKYGGKK